MAIRIPRRRGSEVVGRFGYLEVVRHDLVTEGRGAHEAYTLRTVNWAAVAAVTEDGRFVLVRQHRYGVFAVTIEVAGGIIDPGESPEIAAVRELREETGYTGAGIESLGVVHPNPAMQDNHCYLFLVREAREVGEAASDDPYESVEPLVMSRDDLVRALWDGQITHALSVLTLERALTRT
jgi:8-oxo-dGTP pyrophosphatase MutT (NUDIX family)